MILLYILAYSALVLPLFLSYWNGYDLLGQNFPIGFGLFLQLLLGSIILLYVSGAESNSNKKKFVLIGYTLFFSAMSYSYFAGKSVLFLLTWEFTSYAALLIYSPIPLKRFNASSIASLLSVSGISMVTLSAWIFTKDPILGSYFLLAGLLIKSGFSGLHVWLPELYAGAPPHIVAAFSGIMENLPIILFAHYIAPIWSELGIGKYLIPIAGLGVFLGGVTAFFQKDLKKSLAYSTIENLNLIWLCLFLSLEWGNSENMDLRMFAQGFKVLFYIAMFHHSVSKPFQFFSFGYISEISDSNSIDQNKGFGRLAGISPLLLGMGTFSFALLPGTTGFISESTLLYLFSLILDLPVGSSVHILPSIVLLLFGSTMGSFAHLRIFLPVVLSTPASDKKPFSPPSKIILSLRIMAGIIFLFPIAITAYLFLGYDWNVYMRDWFRILFIISTLSVFFYTFIYLKFFKVDRKKLTWDCGSNYSSSNLSVPSSIFSDPLHNFIGRHFTDNEGVSKLDFSMFGSMKKFLETGTKWKDFVDSGKVSNYLAFSSLFLLASLVILVVFGGFR